MKINSKKIITKSIAFVKKHKIKSIIGAVLLLLICFLIFKPKPEPKRDVVTIEPTTVLQEVSVTGRVEAAEALELALQSGGKVSTVRVKTGDRVRAGQLLLQVNTSDLHVRLARAQAALERARLEQRKDEPKTTAEDRFIALKENTFSVIADAYLDVPAVINDIDTIFTHDYINVNTITNKYGSTGRTLFETARNDFRKAKDAYKDAVVHYRALSREDSIEKITQVADETIQVTKDLSDSLKRIKSLIDYIESKDGVKNQTQEDSVAIEKMSSTVNTHLAALLDARNNVKNAQFGIDDAAYDRTSLGLSVRQAELDVQDILVQINERTIYAPIAGVVTDIEAKVGETVSPGVPLVGIISDTAYQVTANIPESDMAKLTSGMDASITLDAYSSDVVFPAKVVSVSPAGRLVDGVATYKTTFQFTESDERIKAGMTADIIVKGEQKENVFAVPQRAVVTKDGVKYVQVLVDGEVKEKEVVLGFRGTDGLVEIIEGVAEGDTIIVFSGK